MIQLVSLALLNRRFISVSHYKAAVPKGLILDLAFLSPAAIHRRKKILPGLYFYSSFTGAMAACLARKPISFSVS
jgi:hypothetical protein